MINSIIEKSNIHFNNIVALSGISITHDDMKRGVCNAGNPAAIARVLRKAANKEEINICFFGGSITAGAGFNSPPPDDSGIDIKIPPENNIYCNRVAAWFQRIFGCKVNLFNSGIGATDTQYATHRMAEDVLSFNPDFVINEWCMNDNPNMSQKWGTYESVVRKLLEKDVALLLFSFCGTTGFSAQDVHTPVAKHYDVPMLSYKDAFFSHPQFEYFSNDKVHPNMLGHPMAALLICDYFTSLLQDLENVSETITPIPSKTYYPNADEYNDAYIARFNDIEDGLIEGIRIIDRGSFYPSDELRGRGRKVLIPYNANYSVEYQPMVIEIDSAKSIHLLNNKCKCLYDGSYILRVNGKEITHESLTSCCGQSFDYIWASDCVFRSEKPQKMTVEIIPTNKIEEDFVSIIALLLV